MKKAVQVNPTGTILLSYIKMPTVIGNIYNIYTDFIWTRANLF